MIQFDGENFDVRVDNFWIEELYFEMGPWLKEHGGQLNVKGGNFLYGTCPLESQPLFVLRFTR